MSITIGEAITRIRTIYLDDINSGADARWSDATIRIAIKSAHDFLLKQAIARGVHQAFRSFATSTLNNGQIVVAPNHKIISVFYTGGSNSLRLPILPAGPRNRTIIALGDTGTIEYDYIAKDTINILTDATSTTITYGNIDVNNETFDTYLCILAASNLFITEGEIPPVLTALKAEYDAAIYGQPITGQVAMIPRPSLISNQYKNNYYFYMKSPQLLEVYR